MIPRISLALNRSVLPAVLAGMWAVSPLAAGDAAAQDRVLTGRVDVTGLPVTVTTVVVKCVLKRLIRTLTEAETIIPTALGDDGNRRVSAGFTVTVRGHPSATSYECRLGFRAGAETRWAGIRGPGCGNWSCGAPGSVILKTGALP